MANSISTLVAITLFGACCASAIAVEPADAEFNAKVAPVLKTYCVTCHGGAKPKSDFAIDALAPKFATNSQEWKEILDRLTEGSMPPKGKPRPTAAEQAVITNWVTAGLTTYQAQKAIVEGRARIRRLNRIEYVNTLRDLLGVDVDVETLPEDGIAGGFDNVDAGLDLSSTLLERYLETADIALDAAFVGGAPPETQKQHIDMVPLGKQIVKHMDKPPMPRFGETTQVREHDIVFQFESTGRSFDETRVRQPGRYRIRISANAERNGKLMTFLVYAGTYHLPSVTTRVVGAFDVSDTPTVVEFIEPMGVNESLRIEPYGLGFGYDQKNPAQYMGPGLAVQWIEIEGPLYDAWPPAETSRLLGNVDLAKGTYADAEAILRRFAARAFRRPVADADLRTYFGLVKSQLDDGASFKDALRVGLKGILCSPDFLYMSAVPGKLSDFDLATRLSYFLWSSTPDDTLADLAGKGELGKPDILRQQVERMLEDPKAHAFTENFTGQWLSLRNIKATFPDKKLYPEFDDYLEVSMPRETQLFFDEILKHDRSILEFVDSDWAMLNERLATLYGIPDVTGTEFRKVSLPPGCHRGGVMTQAAVLKVTANGTTTSPVVRGAWVLNHILGTPPPPPPKDVPALEPDIRGAKTIREQLAKHRQIERCASCHVKIDPPGNALENFDVIGGWREWYRAVSGKGLKQTRIQIGKDRFRGVGQGPGVVAADELVGGHKFADIDGFKKLVLEDPDQFARSLTEKLLIYGTGHGLEFSDRATVRKAVAEIRPKNYGFRALIHTIVQSDTFRSK